MAGEEPAMVSPDPDVKGPAEGIPGELMIPLSVGVEGEEMAVLVEGEVVLVAEAVGNDLALFSIRGDTKDGPLGGIGDGRGSGSDVALSDVGVIAAGDIKPPVGTAPDPVRPVFPSSPGEFIKQFGISPRESLARLGAVKENALGLDAEKIVSVPEKAVWVAGLVEDDHGLVGCSILVSVEKDLDVSGTGDSDLPVLRDGHGPGVMGEGISGKLLDFKPFRDPEGVFGMKTGGGQQDQEEGTGHDDGDQD